MNHRIVSTVVAIIFAFFILAAGIFAWAVTTAGTGDRASNITPNNPHAPVRATRYCFDCHSLEEGFYPITHRYYRENQCGACHLQSRLALVPHAIDMGSEGCPVCHSDPELEFGFPESHLRYSTDQCLLCHPVDSDYASRRPLRAGIMKWQARVVPHPTDGVFTRCTYCHKEELDSLPQNHHFFAESTCLTCHEPGVE